MLAYLQSDEKGKSLVYVNVLALGSRFIKIRRSVRNFVVVVGGKGKCT